MCASWYQLVLVIYISFMRRIMSSIWSILLMGLGGRVGTPGPLFTMLFE